MASLKHHCQPQWLCIIIMLLAFFPIGAAAAIRILAAENVYGEVAKQIGGPYVNVTNILSNPTQDPHLFTISPTIAKLVSEAEIIVLNGANYDPWAASLLGLPGRPNRQSIDVSLLMKIKPGSNPHLWYLPAAIPTYAEQLTILLSKLDPAHRAYFQQQLSHFKQDNQAIVKTIAELKTRFHDTPVIATEPLFGYMAKAIGLQIHGEGFQTSMMNDVPPSISDMKQFEDDLRRHHVRVLIYNNQVINPLTEHMQDIAKQEGIPILGVSETMPSNMTYVQWILGQLEQLQAALDQTGKPYLPSH